MFPVGVFALFQQPGDGPGHALLRMVEMVAGIPFESGLDTVRPDPLHHFGGAGVHPAHQRMACGLSRSPREKYAFSGPLFSPQPLFGSLFLI